MSTMYYLLLYVIICVAMIVVTNATNNLHVTCVCGSTLKSELGCFLSDLLPSRYSPVCGY